MEVDVVTVVAEVSEAFSGYEAALVAGDVPALGRYFWDAAGTVRFGIADHQYGAAALHRWRAAQPALPPGRQLFETAVTTFGADFAVVTTRFRYPGTDIVGRQSQTWVRLTEGWRIVSAHVSEPAITTTSMAQAAGAAV